MNDYKSKMIKSIEILRFMFMLVICIWHSPFNVFTSGFIFVDFFFILSGYFLYKSLLKGYTPGVYIKKRIIHFYDKYIIAYFITLFIWVVQHRMDFFYNPIENILRVIPECFLMQDVGCFQMGINNPLWYLSVLVLGGCCLFSFLYINNKNKYFLPLIIIFIYPYVLNHNNGNIEVFGFDGIFYLPMIRGLADMSLGCLLNIGINRFDDEISKYSKVIDVCSLLSFIFIIVILFHDVINTKYIIIFFPIIIIACFNNSSLINKIHYSNISIYLGSLSLYMYLIHTSVNRCILSLLQYININKLFGLILYIFIIITISVIFKTCYEKLFRK